MGRVVRGRREGREQARAVGERGTASGDGLRVALWAWRATRRTGVVCIDVRGLHLHYTCSRGCVPIDARTPRIYLFVGLTAQRGDTAFICTTGGSGLCILSLRTHCMAISWRESYRPSLLVGF